MTNQNTHKKISQKFKRLLKDEAGNTIIFMGAALIPILALIGGGVDASRGYMAKARLQQACDAATLAGRRAVGNGTFDLIAEQEADRLFNANFEQSDFGATNTVFTARSTDGGSTVTGEVTSSIPTIIMRIFGNETLDLAVECQAALDIANADITMVLDTTGSMRFNAAGADLFTNFDGSARPGSRMFALRDAAKSFYQVINNAASQTNARIRYGFVPYSFTVNVGELIANNSGTSLLVGDNPGDTHTYPTRRAVYEIDLPDLITTGQTFETFTRSDGREALFTFNQCDQGYGQNNSFQYYIINNSGVPTLVSHNQTNAGNPITIGNTTFTYRRSRRTNRRVVPGVGNLGHCVRRVDTVTRTPQTGETFDGTEPTARFLKYQYTNLSLPINSYALSIDNSNPAVRNPSFPIGTNSFNRWEGCIEERDTINAEATNINLPLLPGLTDLDINSLPSSPNNRWRPYWPEITYYRTAPGFGGGLGQLNLTRDPTSELGFKSQTACAEKARLLVEYPADIDTDGDGASDRSSNFDAYIDSLKPNGGTYHDIGAIWGGRLASPNGIFSNNVNLPAPNNGFVSRNLIFLTDGELEPGVTSYSAYGTEYQNTRVGSSSPVVPIRPRGNVGFPAENYDAYEDLRNRHDARFLAACDAIKAESIRIFVVAFGTGLTPSLQRCASVNSAFAAANNDQLEDAFLQIATNIADLRLTN